MGHGREYWQNVVHWRREWQTTSAFLPWEPHEQNEKAKRYDTESKLPRSLGSQYATGEEQRNSSRGNEVELSSLTQSCPTLCDPMNCSTPGLPVHHQLLEFTQTHVHWVGDAIQPSHPLLSPSPPALNLSLHQGPFKWVSSSHQVAKVLEFQLQYQSFQMKRLSQSNNNTQLWMYLVVKVKSDAVKNNIA